MDAQDPQMQQFNHDEECLATLDATSYENGSKDVTHLARPVALSVLLDLAPRHARPPDLFNTPQCPAGGGCFLSRRSLSLPGRVSPRHLQRHFPQSSEEGNVVSLI